MSLVVHLKDPAVLILWGSIVSLHGHPWLFLCCTPSRIGAFPIMLGEPRRNNHVVKCNIAVYNKEIGFCKPQQRQCGFVKAGQSVSPSVGGWLFVVS